MVRACVGVCVCLCENSTNALGCVLCVSVTVSKTKAAKRKPGGRGQQIENQISLSFVTWVFVKPAFLLVLGSLSRRLRVKQYF